MDWGLFQYADLCTFDVTAPAFVALLNQCGVLPEIDVSGHLATALGTNRRLGRLTAPVHFLIVHRNDYH